MGGGTAFAVGRDSLLERSEQLNALRGALTAVVASGQGRTVLVSGEAGIGKTACSGSALARLRRPCPAAFERSASAAYRAARDR